jgi:hypothetical protein
MEHRVAEMDSTSSQTTPNKVIPSEQARCILGIDHRQVQEYTLDDEEDADGSYDNANTGRNPVDIWSGGPREDEQTDGHEEGDDQGGYKAAFRHRHAVGADFRLYTYMPL